MDAPTGFEVEVEASENVLVAPFSLVVIISSPILILTIISGLSMGSVKIAGPSKWVIPEVEGGCSRCARNEFAASLIKLMSCPDPIYES